MTRPPKYFARCGRNGCRLARFHLGRCAETEEGRRFDAAQRRMESEVERQLVYGPPVVDGGTWVQGGIWTGAGFAPIGPLKKM